MNRIPHTKFHVVLYTIPLWLLANYGVAT